MGFIIKRTRRNAILGFAAGAVLFLATIAALVGLGLWLAQSLGAIIAAFIVTLGLVVVGVVILAVMFVLDYRERQKQSSLRTTRAVAVSAAASSLPLLIRSNKPLAVLAIGGLAFFAAKASRR